MTPTDVSPLSGLTRPQRHLARHRALHAATVALHHAPAMHYTEVSPARWDGILQHRDAGHGQFPHHADCSAFVTWCIWYGVLPFIHSLHLKDIVNGSNWEGGYTGTMLDNGRTVSHHSRSIRADAVMYGDPVSHTAFVAGHRTSDNHLMVISHGSEPGPFLLPYDYRPDVHEVRRFI